MFWFFLSCLVYHFEPENKLKKCTESGVSLSKNKWTNQLSLKRQLLSKWSHFPLELWFFFEEQEKQVERAMSGYKELLKLSWSWLHRWLFYFRYTRNLAPEQQAIPRARAKRSVLGRAGKHGSNGKGKINQTSWNCSFWTLQCFCSDTHWTWRGNIKTTSLASEVRAIQQLKSLLFQTLKLSNKLSL